MLMNLPDELYSRVRLAMRTMAAGLRTQLPLLTGAVRTPPATAPVAAAAAARADPPRPAASSLASVAACALRPSCLPQRRLFSADAGPLDDAEARMKKILLARFPVRMHARALSLCLSCSACFARRLHRSQAALLGDTQEGEIEVKDVSGVSGRAGQPSGNRLC